MPEIIVSLGQPDPRGLDALITWIAEQIALEVLAEAEALKGIK